MKWVVKEPKPGDIVRVKVSFYYHYGIYEDAEHIIQFGLPDNSQTAPDKIAVITTDMTAFLNGGMLETGCMSLQEKVKRRSVKETIAYAHSKLGTTGYNILHNNCEHFVNECVFGEAKSQFIDDTRNEIKKKL